MFRPSTARRLGAAEELLLEVPQESMDDGLTRAWALYWTSAALLQAVTGAGADSQLSRIRALRRHCFAMKSVRHSRSGARLGAVASLRCTLLVHVRQAAVGQMNEVFKVPHAFVKLLWPQDTIVMVHSADSAHLAHGTICETKRASELLGLSSRW